MIFDKFPSGTLHGDGFGEDKGLKKQLEKMSSQFRVVRVQGRVRWKDHGSGDPSAVLRLKRRKSRRIFGELDLAKYARGSSPDEVTTVEFNFKPPEQNSFWQQGATGKVAPDLRSI